MSNPSDEQLPEGLEDWAIAEQIFKDSGLESSSAESEQIDFLKNINMVGRYLSTLNGPVVQFSKFSNQNILLAFNEDEPVDLPSPFYPVDDEHQVWVINNRDIDDLEISAFDSPQISGLTAFGYDASGRMFLFNSQAQRILGINGQDDFSRAMVRAVAVEHIMEPWNSNRSVYLVGFESPFGDALKHQLSTYHSSISVVEKITDIAHGYDSLEDSSIFSIGQDAAEVSEFVKSSKEYSVAVVADVQIGGAFTYYQETEDSGALEPGNIYLQPMLLSDDSEDYAIVLENYQKALDEGTVPDDTSEEVDEFEQIVSGFEYTAEVDGEPEPSVDENESEHEMPIVELKEAADIANTEPLLEEQPAEQPALPDSYLVLMNDKPKVITSSGDITGINAEIIAYTYLQQEYGSEPATFASLCSTLWNADASGPEKSKLSQRRKRAKDKVNTLLPEVQFITERDGWQIKHLTSDIELLATHPQIVPSANPLSKTAWAAPFTTILEKKIEGLTGRHQ